MINRELIRLKVIQLIYAYYQNEGKDFATAEKELIFSLSKAYDLYQYLLSILVDLKLFATRKTEVQKARSARLGRESSIASVDNQFSKNKFLCQLATNETLAAYRTEKEEWIEEPQFIKKLYAQCIESDIYDFYFNKADFSYEADREIIRKLYKTFICNNDDFDALLEEHSLYWNDDKCIVDSFVLKTIKRFNEKNGGKQKLLPKYTSEDDKRFAIDLFQVALVKADEIRDLIRNNSQNWEFCRLAFMDVIIMQTALAEIINIPQIPIRVSINEYLDLAKIYSTPKSSSYINGLLDNVVKKLQAENKLLKA